MREDNVNDQQQFEKQVLPRLFRLYVSISTIGHIYTYTHTRVYGILLPVGPPNVVKGMLFWSGGGLGFGV